MPSHQFVFSADKSLSTAGISLASRAAKELAVDTARLMALGRNDMKSTHFSHALAQPDVGAASSHVSSDRNSARLACQGDDQGFFGKTGRIEDLESQTTVFEQLAETLARGHSP